MDEFKEEEHITMKKTKEIWKRKVRCVYQAVVQIVEFCLCPFAWLDDGSSVVHWDIKWDNIFIQFDEDDEGIKEFDKFDKEPILQRIEEGKAIFVLGDYDLAKIIYHGG